MQCDAFAATIALVHCRCRLQMLLAALNLLHETLKSQEGGGRRRQAAESAVTKIIEKFGNSLVDQGAGLQSAAAASPQQGNWQQARPEQHKSCSCFDCIPIHICQCKTGSINLLPTCW